MDGGGGGGEGGEGGARGDGGADRIRAGPRVRLAQLAAQAARRPARSPRHAATEPGDDHSSVRGAGSLVERWLPRGDRATNPRRRLAFGAVAAGVVTVVAVAATVLGTRPEPERAPDLPTVREVTEVGAASHSVASAAASPTTSERATPTSLVVSVVGTVAEPGLITVRSGARVADAIERAGGAADDSDLLAVNLARRVSDGEQIYVGVTPPPGVPAEPPESGASGPVTTSTAGTAGTVDLNTADEGLLDTLPGIGEVMASRILDWRERHGRFTSVDQLREVDGIGDKRFARLSGLVSVG
ncbi:ComEA family DNA-binding protein [Saccharomonospora piscinae]|uniref:ComEA family DNA-binding protein n=1 Tax=Saccharomonospora piscinae TaxID=687388 RepID=UPI00207BCFBE|nr:ComEA family DNA-binding protein [Saccharomonospora piscinae]